MAQSFGPPTQSPSSTATSINRVAGIGDPKNIGTNMKVHAAQAQANHGLSPAGAQAYVQGNDVQFGAGDRTHMAAHEAAHVVQQ